jgi:hypothetical protein
MYGAETWTWTEADISRLMAEEMRFLISTEGKTKRDREEAKKIRNTLECKVIK